MNAHIKQSAMNRKLLAAALMAAGMSAATAFAQSSVTVFGQISLSLTKASGTAARLQTTGFGSGIGFRGTEDLGGGLSAFYHIENRFDADTGAAGNPFWAEKTVVGLGGDFGRVQLGRFANAFDDIIGMADAFGESVAQPTTEKGLGETKWANAIGYYTPAFGGFSAALTTATKEAVTPGTGSPLVTSNPFAFNVKYASGPVAVALGYVKNGADNVKTVSLAGNYDFGAAKLFAGYTNSSDVGPGLGDARNMQAGVAVPVSAAGSVRAMFANFKPNTDIGDRDNKLGIGYWHNVSKRTLIFTDVARTNSRVASASTNTNAFDVGIFHRF
jgi:predicted porin